MDYFSIPKDELSNVSIDQDDSPETVALILKAKYGYGLYQFAHCLADLISSEHHLADSSIRPTEVAVPTKFFNDLIDKLRNLKDNTTKCLYAIDACTLGLDVKFFSPSFYKEPPNEVIHFHYEWIKDQFKLEAYFKAIDESIAKIEELKKAIPIKGKGRQIRARNYVLLIWSYIMNRPDNNKTDWQGIADLFAWFYFSLRGTEYANRLLPLKKMSQVNKETFNPDDLKGEIYRLQNMLKSKSYMEGKIEKLRKYYFRNPSEISYWKQIDFTEKIWHDDSPLPIGELGTVEKELGIEENEDGLEMWDSPLIIFPNGKTILYP